MYESYSLIIINLVNHNALANNNIFMIVVYTIYNIKKLLDNINNYLN